MNAVFMVKCPYCGFDNPVTTYKNHEPMQLMYCDVEAGGCEGQFAYKPDIIITVDVKVYKLTPIVFVEPEPSP